VNDQPEKRSDELLGQLAHELSALVRADLELAAAEQGPRIRHVAIEFVVVVAAGFALLLALGAATWAAIAGLSTAVPSWAAALIVAVGWLVVALLLLQHDHPRRLRNRLREQTSAQALARARETRREAQRQVEVTAERLSVAMAEETAERDVRVGVSAAEHLVGNAGQDAEELVKELAAALLAPGKAGISLLERLAGRTREPEP